MVKTAIKTCCLLDLYINARNEKARGANCYTLMPFMVAIEQARDVV